MTWWLIGLGYLALVFCGWCFFKCGGDADHK